jgi:DNA polymerase-4
MADAVAARLRNHGLAGRTVTIKVRFGDFRTITRSTTFPAAVDTGPAVARAAKRLLDEVDVSPGVRLLGVGVTGLGAGTARQLTLEDAAAPAGQGDWDNASKAVDRIRHRFGDDAIAPATLRSAAGIRVKRKGDQQWGPTDP